MRPFSALKKPAPVEPTPAPEVTPEPPAAQVEVTPGEMTDERLAEDIIQRAKAAEATVKQERKAKAERDPQKPEPTPSYITDVGLV